MPKMPRNIARLRQIIRDCTLCPRCCHVDRTSGKVGVCGIGADAVVASAGHHFGEEPVLVGSGGSGTIFFSGCGLRCVFCQNYDISHSNKGKANTPRQIASLALRLQRIGCVNVNFVTPTHVTHAVAEAIHIARQDGLSVPVVYNCGGYESVETLRLLEGLIEIYMPDFKYGDSAAGKKYSGAADYPAVATAALAEMYRQVGPLQLDNAKLATKGVLVRHLVMPDEIVRSRRVIDIVAKTAPNCAINVMGQYRPAFRASEFPELIARPNYQQVGSLREYAFERGLMRVD